MDRGRTVIFSGGELGEWALSELQPGDKLIGADRGALFLIRHGIRPDLAIGDFDSVTKEELEEIERQSEEFVSCDPVLKDYTDTEMALERALADNPSDIVFLGALGTRWDHSLANVHLLVKSLRRGVPARIVDPHNDMTVIDRPLRVEKSRYSHISLLSMTPQVTGITLEGFRYPLHDATLTMEESLGISNVLEGSEGLIRLRTGLLMVILSTD